MQSPPEPALVVETLARLHLGFFELPGGGYGGLGVGIFPPGVELRARRAPLLSADGGPRADRVLAAAHILQRHFGRIHDGGAAIEVRRTIPEHVGLGSGTQLTLAAARLLTRLWDVPEDLDELAALLGRGDRSRVGLEVFRQGGFVAHADLGDGRPQTVRLPFPADWALVLAIPGGRRGLSGEAEAAAFRMLPPMAPGLRDEIQATLVHDLLPGLQRREIGLFGAALQRIQALVGGYFAAVQGGTFAHPRAAQLAAAMQAAGAAAVAQTSWGPTLVGLAPAGDAAGQVAAAAHRVLGDQPSSLVLVSSAAPRGCQWRWEPA